jgi:hypothetical protein
VSTDAPIILKLDSSDADSTGELTFINNKITLSDSQALDTDINYLTGVGLLVTDTNNQQLNIAAFRNNIINITNSESSTVPGDRIYGVYAASDSIYSINFKGGVKENTIDLYNANTSIATNGRVNGFVADNVSLSNDFFGNNIIVDGYAGTSVNNSPSMTALTVISSSTLTINGALSNNRLQSCNFKVDGETNSVILDNNSTLNVTGDIKNNRFMANNSGGQDVVANIFVDNGATLMVGGNFSYNDFFVLNNTESTKASSNALVRAIMQWPNGNIIIGGDFSHNSFDLSNNGSLTYPYNITAILINDLFNVGGNFTYNSFTMKDNLSDAGGNVVQGVSFQAGCDFTLQGNFAYNSFDIADNISDSAGEFAIGFNSPSFVNILGFFQQNTVTITDSYGLTNTGINIVANTGEDIIFDKSVRNNAVTINTTSSNPNTSVGFNIDTSGGGTIKFKGNASQTELISANSQATFIIDDSGGSICYGSAC